MSDKTRPISITLPKNLYVAIKAAAAADQRSISSMIAKILTDYIRNNPSFQSSSDS